MGDIKIFQHLSHQISPLIRTDII